MDAPPSAAVLARAVLPHWQGRLRLSDWRLAVGDGEPGVDDRSCVDIDVLVQSAVVRLRSDTPPDQVERQLVHELLHVRLAALEDVHNLALEHTPPAFDKVADRAWDRACEPAIEALCDALTGTTRADWGPSGSPWNEAFPPDDAAGH